MGTKKGRGSQWLPLPLSGVTHGSVLVTTLAVHVAVLDLFLAGFAHRGDLDGEVQGLTGQRVVAVDDDGVALDLPAPSPGPE